MGAFAPGAAAPGRSDAARIVLLPLAGIEVAALKRAQVLFGCVPTVRVIVARLEGPRPPAPPGPGFAPTLTCRTWTGRSTRPPETPAPECKV